MDITTVADAPGLLFGRLLSYKGFKPQAATRKRFGTRGIAVIEADNGQRMEVLVSDSSVLDCRKGSSVVAVIAHRPEDIPSRRMVVSTVLPF